jgi:hypothetical protein
MHSVETSSAGKSIIIRVWAVKNQRKKEEEEKKKENLLWSSILGIIIITKNRSSVKKAGENLERSYRAMPLLSVHFHWLATMSARSTTLCE